MKKELVFRGKDSGEKIFIAKEVNDRRINEYTDFQQEQVLKSFAGGITRRNIT